MAVVLLANVFLGGGKCPNLGVVNVRILGVGNVRLANNLTPKRLTILLDLQGILDGMFPNQDSLTYGDKNDDQDNHHIGDDDVHI